MTAEKQCCSIVHPATITSTVQCAHGHITST